MHLLHAHALHTYRLRLRLIRLIPLASNVIGSISAGLEIDGLIEDGVKVCLHTQRNKGPILVAWVIM
jgi:hypothetical protein